MTKRADEIKLQEIADNIRLVREFIAGGDLRTFEKDIKTLYAVVRALELVSEAARRLSPELKARHPGIPWRPVEGARNAYRGAYHMSAAVIWNTAHQPLDDLLTVVKAELVRPDNDP